MQVLASHRAARLPVGAAVVGIAVGSILFVGGVFLAWVLFTTPVLTGLTAAPGRPGPAHLALGAAIWGIALVAPPCFAIVGALRLGHVARSLTARPAVRAVARSGAALGDDYLSATNLHLPDGRVVRDLVLGPFGIAIVSELPPPKVTRHTGVSWEIRRSDGRWVHLENPLERASRDAERVRRWIASTERDFVVKVYAAVVTSDPTVTRTATCSVVRDDEIAAWLSALPAARALNPDRRLQIAAAARSLL
ncbi:MAG TPA: hypothetical protein VM427_04610 [Patescibacteria group bacterium]|nr:hypothetical protein [Patescibacteria group bacterium]